MEGVETVSGRRIVIAQGARTAVGSFGGVLSDVPAHELGAWAVTEAMQRSGVGIDEPQEVVMGCVGQVGPDAYNARRVALAAGLPDSVPALTVNRLCGSGLQAVWSAAAEMRWNDLDVTVAGGDESMSRLPFYDVGARSGPQLGDRTLVDGTLAMLTDPFLGVPMGRTAEAVARRYGVSRTEQDAFALESQRRAATPAAALVFRDEIVAVERGGRWPCVIDADEDPRPGTTHEALRALPPAFEDGGTVTAGNASGINDGAAALVLMSEDAARDRGVEAPVALEAVSTAAMDPGLMGYAPVLALRSLFETTGLTPADVDVVELDEAFAAQAVAVMRDAGLDLERTNPYGGSIALGHPVGATGAILTLRVVQHLRRTGGELGIVTMCIGGGQALAALFRRLS